jgi:protein-L-isoaspartate(D-aspartate) O-methyltransferase
VIGQLAARVVAIERHAELALLASDRIERLGYANVTIVEGDGTLGWPAEAPYDAIVAAASGARVPPALIEQLKPGGRLVMPLGRHSWAQSLVKIIKQEDGSLSQETLCAVRFVPLVGAE